MIQRPEFDNQKSERIDYIMCYINEDVQIPVSVQIINERYVVSVTIPAPYSKSDFQNLETDISEGLREWGFTEIEF